MSSNAAAWPELPASHPIIVLFRKLPEAIAASDGYSEIWGVTIAAPTTPNPPAQQPENPDKTEGEEVKPVEPVEQPTFATALILQKFLRANANNVPKALSQLKDTLIWRKSFFSPDGELSKGWSDSKFNGIGFVSAVNDKSGKQKVVSWNVYGATKDIKSTFGDLDEFIRWRVNLMEKSLKLLHLENAIDPIPDYGQGEDQYQSLQVHDYRNVSFLRLPSEVRTASKKTIEMFARYYPETLERKYFINVPNLMSWIYVLLKKILATQTIKKLEILGAGKELVNYLGEDIPEEYGGKGQSLSNAQNGVSNPKNLDSESVPATNAVKDDVAATEPLKDLSNGVPTVQHAQDDSKPGETITETHAEPHLQTSAEPHAQTSAEPHSRTSSEPHTETPAYPGTEINTESLKQVSPPAVEPEFTAGPIIPQQPEVNVAPVPPTTAEVRNDGVTNGSAEKPTPVAVTEKMEEENRENEEKE